MSVTPPQTDAAPLAARPSSKVLILGGGFGGLSTANTLPQLLPHGAAITVVDHSPRFVVGAGKPWVMLGHRTAAEVSAPRASLLEPAVEFLEAEVQAIDLADRTVRTSAGALRWDYLVIALGAVLRQDAVPGLATAHTFYTVAGAEPLKPVLAAFTKGEIAVLVPKTPYKCPAAPYETALLLQDHFARRGQQGRVRINVYTVEGAPMATAGAEMGAFVRGELSAKGIGFHPQKTVLRINDAARRIEFADGSVADYDLLLCVPPHEAPACVRTAQLTGPSGWIPVDPQTLEVKSGGGRVFAIGDITSVPLPGRFKPDLPLVLPKAGTMARAQGEVVAQRIAAVLDGRDATARYDGKGFCFLETRAGNAVRGEGAFFAMPHPEMSRRSPSAEQHAEKLAWVAQQLRPRR